MRVPYFHCAVGPTDHVAVLGSVSVSTKPVSWPLRGLKVSSCPSCSGGGRQGKMESRVFWQFQAFTNRPTNRNKDQTPKSLTASSLWDFVRNHLQRRWAGSSAWSCSISPLLSLLWVEKLMPPRFIEYRLCIILFFCLLYYFGGHFRNQKGTEICSCCHLETRSHIIFLQWYLETNKQTKNVRGSSRWS